MTATTVTRETPVPEGVIAQLRRRRAQFDAHIGQHPAPEAPLTVLIDETQAYVRQPVSPEAKALAAEILAKAPCVTVPSRRRPRVGAEAFIADVTAERRRQLAKWGDQRHPDGTGGHGSRETADRARRHTETCAQHGTLSWREILIEEVFETLAETDPQHLRTELVQVAAVVAAWIYDIDRRRTLPAVLRLADDGLPVYRAHRAPEHLATRRQLREARLSAAALPVAAYLHTMPYHRVSPLFDRTNARPISPLTGKQREALAAGREGRYVPCVLCGTRTIRPRDAEGAYCPNCP